MAKDGYITVHLNFTEQQYFLIKKFVNEANNDYPWSRVSVSRFCQYAIYDYVKRYFECKDQRCQGEHVSPSIVEINT